MERWPNSHGLHAWASGAGYGDGMVGDGSAGDGGGATNGYPLEVYIERDVGPYFNYQNHVEDRYFLYD